MAQPLISEYQARELLALAADYFKDPAVQAAFDAWQAKQPVPPTEGETL